MFDTQLLPPDGLGDWGTGERKVSRLRMLPVGLFMNTNQHKTSLDNMTKEYGCIKTLFLLNNTHNVLIR